MKPQNPEKRIHFIRQMIKKDIQTGKYQSVVTRFPPEPNGYLHIGHAKAICLDFGMAVEFDGKCNLRFDDTNPLNEEALFVDAIIDDVQWLGFSWDSMTYASDYYQQLFDFALLLIKADKAYVDHSTPQEINLNRGTLTEPGKNSPYRDRSVDENLDLFLRMKAGEFNDGACVLRAKIDMQSPNLNMRDPILYRIRRAHHQRTGNAWCIYPMYDFAHPLSDALERITHSLCTLEFQDHRPLYDWFIENLPVPAKPEQTEFARLNLSHTITSKRKLKQLVEEKFVSGWDDPRLPTLRGMRKRGYPAESIRDFCEAIGVSRADSVIDMSILEACVRETLNQSAQRAMCVFDPIKIIIDNYPEHKIEMFQAAAHTPHEDMNERIIPFSREIYIERADFMENPPKDYYRLALGQEVRLRHGYVIRAHDIVYDQNGQVSIVHCTYDETTLGKKPEGRKVKGVIHWVSVQHAHPVEIYEYDRLFLDPNPTREDDFLQFINPDSMRIRNAWCEPALKNKKEGEVFQFERVGYYCVNQVDNHVTRVFHRVVDLKETWSAVQAS